MLIDTGAQVSIINNKLISDKSRINPENKITISSIHGHENTLGEISAIIQKNNTRIPIQLQVAKDLALQEDGIIGFDVLGDSAVINGPKRIITFDTGNSKVDFHIKSDSSKMHISTISQDNTGLRQNFKSKLAQAIQEFQDMEYVNGDELNNGYFANLLKVQEITQEIGDLKIKISGKIGI